MLLCDCAAMVESSNNPLAVRFEPVMFQDKPAWVMPLLGKIAQYNFCDRDTALAIACTSYGRYQILGVNVYDKGFTGSIATFWNNVAMQDTIYERFVSAHGFDMHEDVTTWSLDKLQDYATFYNGPGNVTNYVSAMQTAMKAT